MRKTAVVIASFGVVGSIAAVSEAEPTPITPGVKPPIAQPSLVLPRPPVIASVKHAGRAYAEGPVSLEVEIKNPGSKPLETNLLLDRMIRARPAPQEGGRLASVAVRVPAGGATTVTIADSRGIEACDPTFDRLTLEGGPSTFVKLQPSCAFGVKTINPNEGLAPDRLVSQQSGKLSYDTAFLPFRTARCGAAIVFEATARNRGSARATNVRWRVTSPDGEAVASLEPFELAPGANKTSRSGQQFKGRSGRWQLDIEGTGVSIYQPGFKADVTKLCSVVAELASSVEPPPAPPSQVGE
jgi:hypothetical protein